VGFYSDIFAKQYGRLRTFFDRELKSLQWSDDEANEEIIERLSEIIDLVGEVAIYAAYKEAQSLGDRHFTLERLLTAIASAKDKLTEQSRTKLLLQYALSPDSSARYAAVRALGRMQGGDARARLREISAQEKNPQIARAAEALSK